jgi:hypothetical protein
MSDLEVLKKYPPPVKSAVFERTWKVFISDVVERDNFRPGHLEQLRVLCHLYSEEEELREILTMSGYTMFSEGGRNGPQEKSRPEVAQLNKVRSEIRAYSQMLGLVLHKDKGVVDKGVEDEWE